MQALPPAIDGVEQRLDAILAELRALQARLHPAPPPPDAVVLREPARRGPGRPRKELR